MKGVYDASKHTVMNFCLLVQKYSPPSGNYSYSGGQLLFMCEQEVFTMGWR